MSIYNKTRGYRKIYEQHYGEIPKDENGRTYEIHHIDGDATNNDPANLKAVSIQEHYDIHYDQGDWAACLRISARMKISPEEKTKLAKLNAQKQLAEGTHPWAGDNNWVRQAAREGNHPSQDPKWIEAQRHKMLEQVAQGTHNFVTSNPVHKRVASGVHGQISKEQNLRRIAEGTHNFVVNNPTPQRIKDGTHNFLNEHSVYAQLERGTHAWKGKDVQKRLLAEGNHPTQVKITCPHCGMTGAKPVMTRFHMDKCKHKQ
jgi:transposase-like protein